MDDPVWTIRDVLSSTTTHILKWGVVGSSLLFGWIELIEKRRCPPPKNIFWTILDVAFMVLALSSAILASFSGTPSTISTKMLQEAAEAFPMFAGFIIVIVISGCRQLRGVGVSGYVCVVLGVLLTAAISDLLLLLQQMKDSWVILMFDVFTF